jgi:hypothetical protein
MIRRSILGVTLALAVRPALARPVASIEGFATPEAGFAVFAEAMKAHDEAPLLRLLGPVSRRLIWSGDAVADRAAREKFSAEYAAKAEIQRPAPGRAELLVGADAWPLPIPLVERGGTWRFDAAAGARTLLERRIGRNELATIEVLRAIGDAQAEYAATAGRDGAFQSYARRFFASAGTRDGLYWPTAVGEPQSPLGPLAAEASAGGYRRGATPQPYHGYLFRMLEAQGPQAPGGPLSYVVQGRMIGGFGVLAWPAQWGSSGLATFMTSHHGAVWQANLGRDTAARVRRIEAFDPGPGWTRVG